jgi:hypothetical protein
VLNDIRMLLFLNSPKTVPVSLPVQEKAAHIAACCGLACFCTGAEGGPYSGVLWCGLFLSVYMQVLTRCTSSLSEPVVRHVFMRSMLYLLEASLVAEDVVNDHVSTSWILNILNVIMLRRFVMVISYCYKPECGRFETQ